MNGSYPMSLSAHQRLLGVLLVLFTASLSAGCYTVLKHPRVEMAVDEGGQDCASCHADADLYDFRDPFMDHYGYYDYGITRWYSYYGLPWWYDAYWYYPEHDYGGNHTHDGDGRMWGRDVTTRSPIPRIGSTPEAPKVEGTPSRRSGDQNKETRRDDSGKKKRRLWGRGG
jgi:hypothetical protein